MDINKPCECGSRSKRYTSCSNEWTCNKCKKKTLDYTHPNAFIRVLASQWVSCLPMEKKIEMYLEAIKPKRRTSLT